MKKKKLKQSSDSGLLAILGGIISLLANFIQIYKYIIEIPLMTDFIDTSGTIILIVGLILIELTFLNLFYIGASCAIIPKTNYVAENPSFYSYLDIWTIKKKKEVKSSHFLYSNTKIIIGWTGFLFLTYILPFLDNVLLIDPLYLILMFSSGILSLLSGFIYEKKGILVEINKNEEKSGEDNKPDIKIKKIF